MFGLGGVVRGWGLMGRMFGDCTYLATLSALALLGATVHPMVVGGRLLAILADADIAERRLAVQLGALHHDRHTAGVRHDFARRTFHPGSVFLYKQTHTQKAYGYKSNEILR